MEKIKAQRESIEDAVLFVAQYLKGDKIESDSAKAVLKALSHDRLELGKALQDVVRGESVNWTSVWNIHDRLSEGDFDSEISDVKESDAKLNSKEATTTERKNLVDLASLALDTKPNKDAMDKLYHFSPLLSTAWAAGLDSNAVKKRIDAGEFDVAAKNLTAEMTKLTVMGEKVTISNPNVDPANTPAGRFVMRDMISQWNKLQDAEFERTEVEKIKAKLDKMQAEGAIPNEINPGFGIQKENMRQHFQKEFNTRVKIQEEHFDWHEKHPEAAGHSHGNFVPEPVIQQKNIAPTQDNTLEP